MISIIGAGPVGSYLAYMLAKSGFDVNVYEEHKSIGEPVQCAGIVTSELSRVLELDDKLIINRLNKVKIFSKHRSTTFNVNDIVIDRKKFDRWLADKAKKAGARFHLNHKYLGFARGNIIFADKKNKFIKTKAEKIIGADGPLSDVAKSNFIFDKRKFYIGLQARIKGNFDLNTYEVYLGSICPGFFAWLIPESKTIARVGTAGEKYVSQRFSKFLSIKGLSSKNIVDKQAGLIPIWNNKIRVKKSNIYLIGDAAAQVKASTGGGIVPSLKAAKVLADSIINNKDYNKGLTKINKELKTHLRIRKILNRFSDKDYNNLIKLLSKKRVKKILNTYNRDLSSELVVKMLLIEPRLLCYLRKIV